jgi:hypothetical protein
MNKPIKLQGGKLYSKVVDRVKAFRADFPSNQGWTIQTEIHTLTDNYVVFKCQIIDPEGTVLATGHGFNGIAKDKAMEKAETVSVGRALAIFDPLYGGDYELASAEEISKFHENKIAVNHIVPPVPITPSIPKPTHNPVTSSEPNGIGNLVNKAMDQLTHNSNESNGEEAMSFGKYKGTPLSHLPGDYVEWILGNMDNLDDGLRSKLSAVHQVKRPELNA